MFRPTPTTFTSSQQHHIQTAIIGTGILGLSIARALSKKPYNHEVLLLDQSATIGSGISSRNSEVIHAGIYYDSQKQPLKSKLCVEGNRLLYEYCTERSIAFKNCGKLLVAMDRAQRDVDLLRLVKYAKSNGVNDLRIVSKEEIADPYSNVYEPNVECSGGVHSPSTGIVDSHMVMMSLLGEAEECGAMLALNSRVEGGEIITPSSSSSSGGGEGSIMLTVDGVDIACDNVIVCAGLASDKIASSIVLGKTPNEIDDIDKRQQQQQQNHHNNNHFQKLPKQYYAKGNYFKLENQKSPFTRLIYPLPDPNGGLGVHATIDLAGSTRFGPDVEWLPPDINLEDIDMTVNPKRADSFYDAVRRYWPELGDGNLVPDYSGIRPKLMHPHLGNGNDSNNNNNNTHPTDFLIAGREYHGVKGLTVLLGMESPGLTSSLAIGDYVARIIE